MGESFPQQMRFLPEALESCDCDLSLQLRRYKCPVVCAMWETRGALFAASHHFILYCAEVFTKVWVGTLFIPTIRWNWKLTQLPRENLGGNTLPPRCQAAVCALLYVSTRQHQWAHLWEVHPVRGTPLLSGRAPGGGE